MTWRRVCCVCMQLLLFDCVSPSAVADPRGSSGGAESAAAPPLFRPIFVFLADFCYFRARHRGIWIAGLQQQQKLSPPPPLFTDPGSASGQCSVRFMIPDTVVGFENEMVSAVPVTWVAMKMNWAVQWSEFWAGMRFLDFKLSCIASRRANINYRERSGPLVFTIICVQQKWIIAR